MRHGFRSIPGLRRNARGIILLLVLGILGLLSVMAVTFVSVSRLERSVSENYVARTRAVLAAESGVEYAISRIQGFRGGLITPDELDSMTYEQGDYSVPLSSSDDPSFHIPGKPYSGVIGSSNAEDGDRYKLRVADLSTRVNLNDSNGLLNYPSSSPNYGDRRLTRLIVNLTDIVFQSDPLYLPGTGDLIGVDIEQFRETRGRFSSMEEVRTLLVPERLSGPQFDRFAQFFSVHGWQDSSVLRPTFKVSISVPSGIAPAPLYADGGADLYLYRDMQTKRFEREPRTPVNVNVAPAETLQALLGQVSGWYLEEGPGETLSNYHYGNFNITDVGGARPFYYYYADESLRGGPPNGAWGPDGSLIGKQNIFGKIRRCDELKPAAAQILAQAMWDRIHVEKTPFRTWEEYDRFLLEVANPTLEAAGEDALSKYQIDALRANANPNSRLNDYNPNRSFFLHVDKSQLCAYSTEFCFEPTGCFEIGSFGEILDEDGARLAWRQVDAVVKVFEYVRKTTQRDFMEGAESCADLRDYFSESTMFTTVHSDPTGNLYGGHSLQSYPEVTYSDATPANQFAILRESEFDGSLMLATWQSTMADAEIDTSGDSSIDVIGAGIQKPNVRMAFIDAPQPDTVAAGVYDAEHSLPANFNTLPASGQILFNQPSGVYPPSDTRMRLTAPSDFPDPFMPSALLPDGALSDTCRTVGMRSGNFSGDRGRIGSLHYWIKPNFDPAVSNRPRLLTCFYKQGNGGFGPMQHSLFYFTRAQDTRETVVDNFNYYFGDMIGAAPGNWIPTRTLAYGYAIAPNPAPDNFWSWADTSMLCTTTVNHESADDNPAEHADHPLFNVNSHTWNHIGIAWNYYAPNGGGYLATGNLAMCVNGVVVPDYQYYGTEPNGFAQAKNYWSHDFFGVNVIRFGETARGHANALREKVQNYTADATVDDVFGYARYINGNHFKKFWNDGRYYSGDDAVYTSPAIDLLEDAGLGHQGLLRPRSVAWTVYWPRNNRDRDSVVDNLRPANVDGDVLDSVDPEDEILDDPLAAVWGAPLDPVSVDLGIVTGDATTWLSGDEDGAPFAAPGLTSAGGCVLPAKFPTGEIFQLSQSTKLRYRVRFNLEIGQTVYESPVFDDISFTFFVRPRILSWVVGQ